MHYVWVLVALFNVSGSATYTRDFPTEATCKAALIEIAQLAASSSVAKTFDAPYDDRIGYDWGRCIRMPTQPTAGGVSE